VKKEGLKNLFKLALNLMKLGKSRKNGRFKFKWFQMGLIGNPSTNLELISVDDIATKSNIAPMIDPIECPMIP